MATIIVGARDEDDPTAGGADMVVRSGLMVIPVAGDLISYNDIQLRVTHRIIDVASAVLTVVCIDERLLPYAQRVASLEALNFQAHPTPVADDPIRDALEHAMEGHWTDGGHHKQWYLCEVIKALGGRIGDGVDEGIPG